MYLTCELNYSKKNIFCFKINDIDYGYLKYDDCNVFKTSCHESYSNSLVINNLRINIVPTNYIEDLFFVRTCIEFSNHWVDF